MVKNNELPYQVALALLVLEDVQLLIFSWYPSYGYGKTMPYWITYLFSPFLSLSKESYFHYIIVFLILLTIVLISTGFTGLCGFFFHQGNSGSSILGLLSALR
jgi:hypothetical protein